MSNSGQAAEQDTRLPPPDVLQGPLAREMGKLLRKLIGSEDPYDQRFYHGRYYADSEYRQWIRKRLREDHFLARLGGGIGMLPDIRESLPYVQAWIESQNRPVTMPRMIRHMCRNLEWYLRPGSEPIYSRQLIPTFYRFVGSLVISIAGGFVGGGSIGESTAGEIIAVISGLIAFFAMLLAAYLLLKLLAELANFGSACGETPGSMKHTINAAELYLYLIELYEERPLVPLAAGDLSADEQSEAEATETRMLTELAVDPAESSLGEIRRRIETRG